MSVIIVVSPWKTNP